MLATGHVRDMMFEEAALLLREREAVRAARSALRVAKRKLDSAVRWCHRIERRQNYAAAFTDAVAVAVYVRSGYSRSAAGAYVQSRARIESHKRECSLESASKHAESCFLCADTDAVAKRMCLTTTMSPVDAAASRFLNELQLAQWVLHANTSKGVAPSAARILEQLSLGHTQFSDADAATDTRLSRNRMWALRWRKRFGACISRIRTRDILPPDDLRAKACARSSS
jgi:hypothetical protein